MPVSYLIPPIKSDEPFVGGYGHLETDYMIVLPSAPISVNRDRPLSCMTPETEGKVRHIVQSYLKTCYVTPLVKHRRNLKAKTLYAKDIRYWLPVLYQEIDLIRPKRILVMGKFVAQYLIPNFIRMDQDHGTLFTVKGSEIDESLSHLESMVIVPTFSFNDLMTNLMARPYFQNDLKRFRYTEVIEPKWEVPERLADIPIPDGKDITIDVETGGFDLGQTMHMIGVGYDDKVFIVHHPTPDDLVQFMENLNNSTSTIVFHNATFDLAHMIRSSEMRAPMPNKRIGDVMVRAHISGVKDKSLKHLTSIHTDLPGPHSGGRFHDEQYLAEDIRSTLALKDIPDLNRARGTYASDLYHDLAPIFVDMRLRGVYLNRDKILEILVASEEKLLEATYTLNQHVSNGTEINWNSAQQVADLMLGLGIPLTAKTPTGAFSVAEGALEELLDELKEEPNGQFSSQIEMINALLSYRSWSKLVSGFLRSYLDLIDEHGLIYPNLKLLGTVTGRLSCSDPNLQQIPRVGDFKLCFEPRWCNPHFTTAFAPGYYGLVDFAGAELRMAAIISGDRQMAEFILSGDPHSHMAKIAYPDKIPSSATVKEIKEDYAYWRKASKKTTFAMLYGGSVRGIAFKNGVPESEIAAVETALRTAAPDLMAWLDKTKAECLSTLRISTLFGNQRSLVDKLLYEGEGGVQRAGINTPIQGASGILALVVLRKLHRLCIEENLISRPIFGVHDSILSEIAEHEVEIYSDLVQRAYLDIENSPIVDYPVYQTLGIQGDLEIGRNWANVESTNEHVDILRSVACDSRCIPD